MANGLTNYPPATQPRPSNTSTTNAAPTAHPGAEEPHISVVTQAPGSPAPATAEQSPPSPASSSGPVSAPVLSYGVDLQQTIEAVHATIELATRQGLTQARIALAPAELGEIRIHLSQGAQGLIARFTADTPAAAQALAEGHAELRQSLHSLGLTALHMDTSAFDEAGAHQREGRAQLPFTFTSSTGSGQSSSAGDEEEQDMLPDVPSDPSTIAAGPLHGTLVDVLA